MLPLLFRYGAVVARTLVAPFVDAIHGFFNILDNLARLASRFIAILGLILGLIADLIADLVLTALTYGIDGMTALSLIAVIYKLFGLELAEMTTTVLIVIGMLSRSANALYPGRRNPPPAMMFAPAA